MTSHGTLGACSLAEKDKTWSPYNFLFLLGRQHTEITYTSCPAHSRQASDAILDLSRSQMPNTKFSVTRSTTALDVRGLGHAMVDENYIVQVDRSGSQVPCFECDFFCTD